MALHRNPSTDCIGLGQLVLLFCPCSIGKLWRKKTKRHQHQNIFFTLRSLNWTPVTGQDVIYTHVICFSKFKDALINIRALCCVSVEELLYIYKSVL